MSQSNVFNCPEKSMRAFFAGLWKEYLRAHYRNPEEVCVAFGVRFQTGLNWWNGDNAPSGCFVALEFGRNPEGARRHLTGIPAE